MAAGSIVFGAFGALGQTKIKRFIGYTSINQMGYLLIGVSCGDLLGLQASFLYMYFYLIMGFSFFSIILYVADFGTSKDILFINQLQGFGSKHKNLAAILALVLFSMAGIPPLAGFFGKSLLFFSAFRKGYHSLIILGLLMNIISSFYYLRIIKCIYFESPKVTKGPTYFFFLGSGCFATTFELVLGFFIVFLTISPFFLNGLLTHFAEIAFFSSHVIL